MTEELLQIIDLVQSVGVGVIFLWLLIRAEARYEAKLDKETVKYTALLDKYLEDLRVISGIRQNLQRVQTFVSDAKQVDSASEMKTFP